MCEGKIFYRKTKTILSDAGFGLKNRLPFAVNYSHILINMKNLLAYLPISEKSTKILLSPN